jgi:hypothetical protein
MKVGKSELIQKKVRTAHFITLCIFDSYFLTMMTESPSKAEAHLNTSLAMPWGSCVNSPHKAARPLLPNRMILMALTRIP